MEAWDMRWPRTVAAVGDGMSRGLHIGAQIFVRFDGAVACDGAVGLARPERADRAGVDLASDALVPWLSSGKPVAAIAVMQLRERGLLELDDPVCRHIPEFADNGKQSVTIEHLLAHTGGFRFLDWGDADTPWPEIVRRLCAAPLEKNWTPGSRAGYHPYTSWFVLGELVNRLSGKFFSDYVRQHIFLPLGMSDCWIGMPTATRAAYGDRIAELVDTERLGGDGRPILTPHPWSTDAGLVACVPGGNGHGPLRQLARLYEMLSGHGVLDGVRLLSPESVRLMTSRRRVGMFDETFRHALDWGLGLIPNNRRYGVETAPYGYGRHAGDSAFGHSGSQSSAVFADPEQRLIAAVFLNGACGERRHQPRMRAVLEAVYEDLGVVRDD